jgi:hypothetical protein
VSSNRIIEQKFSSCSEPELRFASLVIRRTQTASAGVLETDNDTPDVCALVRGVAGVPG